MAKTIETLEITDAIAKIEVTITIETEAETKMPHTHKSGRIQSHAFIIATLTSNDRIIFRGDITTGIEINSLIDIYTTIETSAHKADNLGEDIEEIVPALNTEIADNAQTAAVAILF